MKQNEYLANKLDRQREIDVKRYVWEDDRKKHHISGFVVALFVVFCIAGWVSEAFAWDYANDLQYQNQVRQAQRNEQEYLRQQQELIEVQESINRRERADVDNYRSSGNYDPFLILRRNRGNDE